MIDIHSHVVPDGVPFGITGDPRWPELHRAHDHGDVIIAGKLFRRVSPESWDMGARRVAMQHAGLTHQVISPMPELFAYWAEAQDGFRYCQAINEWIVERVRGHPEDFSGLGIVPAQDVEIACTMLAEVAAMGLSGVEVGSMVNGRPIASREYLEFFSEAARLGLCVFIHAFHPLLESFLDSGAASNGVTFPLDSTFSAAALVANGMAAEIPDLRIAFSHGGGGVAMTVWRLEMFWRTDPAFRDSVGSSPLAMLRRFFFDSLLFDSKAISYLVDVVGPEAICVGTDFPFFEMSEGVTPLLDAVRDETQHALVTVENARRFLGTL